MFMNMMHFAFAFKVLGSTLRLPFDDIVEFMILVLLLQDHGVHNILREDMFQVHQLLPLEGGE